MLPQDAISADTPLGAALVPGGATFKVWAPLASAVYLNGTFGGAVFESQSEDRLMIKDGLGFWTGFQAGAREGDRYHYWVEGEGSTGFKRAPTARELDAATFPNAYAILRSASTYPWHDGDFRAPDYSAMVVYQAHIGTFATRTEGRSSTLLEVACLAPYLASLGVNVLQPLPVDEQEAHPSMGYGGADLFSPDFPYVASAADVDRLAPRIDAILAQKGLDPLPPGTLLSAPNQIKALVDLCHVHGIAVVFDVVYNHAGGFAIGDVGDDYCLYYFDRERNVGDNNDSLYFTNQDRGTGGLAFAMWKTPVRQFLQENVRWYADDLHADGLRYDEISILLSTNQENGWEFCRELTTELRSRWPRFLQNAEFWPREFGDTPNSALPIVAPVTAGGAGFDVVQHDYLRKEIRDAIQAVSQGGGGPAPMSGIAAALYPPGFDHAWRTVTCVENHDLVYVGRQQRIAALADPSNHRSWYARSRARVAAGLLLTAPGIPQIFMGQEFLEDKQWNSAPNGENLIWWAGFEGADKAMSDHWRCIADLIALRRQFEALHGDSVNPYYVNDDDRVMAFQRWIDGVGGDVVVVVSLAEFTRSNYRVGMPGPGVWREAFNSDTYDNFPNPWVAGNGGSVVADGPPMHELPSSAAIVIPANSVLVFAR
jgi:1,4-alpha-glucan branching enzyme